MKIVNTGDGILAYICDCGVPIGKNQISCPRCAELRAARDCTDDLERRLAAALDERDELRAACQKVLADTNHGFTAEENRHTLIAALEKTSEHINPNAGVVAPHGSPKGRWTP